VNEFLVGFIDEFTRSFREVYDSVNEGFEGERDSAYKFADTAKAIGKVVGYLGYIAGESAANLKLVGDAFDFVVEKVGDVKAFVVDAWDYIGDKTQDVWEGLKDLFTGIGTLLDGIVHFSPETILEGLARVQEANFSRISGDKTYDAARRDLQYKRDEEETERRIKELGLDEPFLPKEDPKKGKGGSPKGEFDVGGGGGRGGRGKSVSGERVDFGNYAGFVPRDLSAYLLGKGFSNNIQNLNKLSSIEPSKFGPEKLPPIKPVINISSFVQNIDGGDSSPTEIADEVYTKFTTEIGRRIVRSPMPLTT
jgi:hypothetical protein